MLQDTDSLDQNYKEGVQTFGHKNSLQLLSAHLHAFSPDHPSPKQKQSPKAMGWKEKAGFREGWISPASRMAPEAQPIHWKSHNAGNNNVLTFRFLKRETLSKI